MYIDFNVLTKYINDNDVREKIIDLKKRYDFYCSPAHFEEFAKISRRMKDSKEYIYNHLQKLKELTEERIVYFPNRSIDDKITLMDSGMVSFTDVLQTTIANNGMILSAIVEENDKFWLQHWKQVRIAANGNGNNKCEYSQEKIKCLNTKCVSSYTTENIFESSAVKFICDNTNWEGLEITPQFLRKSFERDIEKPYQYFEADIECAMKILNYCGYHSDTRNLESPTHDISHAHYGAICDYFLTFDKKFFYRIKAAYYWLGVPTRVYLFPDFINLEQ